MPAEQISLSHAARIAGVSPSTLKRWAAARVVPVKKGRWTLAAAAAGRVVARMRERGHSLEESAPRRSATAGSRSATPRICCRDRSGRSPAPRRPSGPGSSRS